MKKKPAVKTQKSETMGKKFDILKSGSLRWVTILVLAACLIVGILLSLVLFYKNPGVTYASADLVLTFDGAATGTAPNGVAFDVRALECDEVLNAGLKAAELDGVYTPEQIRSCLTVRGIYPQDMVEQVMYYESLLVFSSSRELTVGNYHPTTFNVRLSDSFDGSISQGKLKQLLNGILEAYRAYFARVYSYSLEKSNGLFDLDYYDYPQQLEIIEGRFDAVSRYALELYRKDPDFLFRGASFNDIYVRLSALLDSSITKMNANLIINGLTRNVDRLLTQYQYQIQDLSTRKKMQEQELKKLDELIASYEKNEIIYLPSSDSMTKIDGNSSATYDALVSKRKTISDGITELNSRIANYNLRILDLTSTGSELSPAAVRPGREGSPEEGEAAENVRTPSAAEIAMAERKREAQRAALEDSIHALMEDGESVISDFQAMLESYNAQQINESNFALSKPVYVRPKLLNGTFVLQTVEVAGPIVALGLIFCIVLILISRKREEADN